MLCGSDTDFPLAQSVCEQYTPDVLKIQIGWASCHRNPEIVQEVGELLAENGQFDLIVGVGSKALALPGVIDAWIHYFAKRPGRKKDILVAGVALGEPGSKNLNDAIVSIDGLPSQPVIMDENGVPYQGAEGLKAVLDRAIRGEFTPPKERKEKDAKLRAWANFE